MVEKEKVMSLRQSLIINDGFLQHVICLCLLIYIMVLFQDGGILSKHLYCRATEQV